MGKPKKGKNFPSSRNNTYPKGKNPKRSSSEGDKLSRRQREVESVDMRKADRIAPESRSGADFFQGRPNDWRWYAQNEQLVTDYASYPFGAPVGNLLQSGLASIDAGSIPGVMAFPFIPTIGVADNENAPINVAMRKLYSFVRHANSGASNYDAPDLMLYMLAVDSAMMFHSFLKRAYGVMMDYTAFNRYYPRALVTAMNLNFDDIERNLNDFRGYINQYAVKLSQLWVPNSMSYMARHTWMCEGLYTDSNTAKAQTYFYYPAMYLQFALDNDGVGSCEYVYPPNKATLSSLITFGNSLLNAMIPNEDFGIMSGDILKAFGESGIVKVSGITEDYRILPVYDQEVLSQMENATLFRDQDMSSNITQAKAVGTGYLIATPKIGTSISGFTAAIPSQYQKNLADAAHAPLTANHLLNFHHGNVTPSEVMVATRLTNVCGPVTSVTTSSVGSNFGITAYSSLLSCGSEICLAAQMYNYVMVQGSLTLKVDLVYTNMNKLLTGSIDSAAASVGSFVGVLTKLATFDWHPQIIPIVFQDSAESGTDVSWSSPQGYLMDVDWFTPLNEMNLRNMHMTALLSEFSIPMIT